MLATVQPLPTVTGAAGIGASWGDVLSFGVSGMTTAAFLLSVGVYSGHTVTLRIVAKDASGNAFPFTFYRLDTGDVATSLAFTSAATPHLALDLGNGCYTTIALQAMTSATGQSGDSVAGQVNLSAGVF